jgi:hypothetical protein
MKFVPKIGNLRYVGCGFAPVSSFLLLLVALAPASLSAQPLAARVEPAATNAALGSSVTLCIEAQGAGPFSYQWQKNGLNLSGQTNRCLTLANLAIADGAGYRATVFDAAGALESEEGVLTIDLDDLPGADGFSGGTSVVVASNSVKGANFSATRETGEPVHYLPGTSNSVWYAWRAPATGIVTFDTKGSGFDTVLAVYVGNYPETLREIVSDDDDGGFHTSQVSWNATTGMVYRIVIDGVTGEAGNYVCNWNLETTSARLPVITMQPRSQTVPPGGTASFTVMATDPRVTLAFQWFRNGGLLPGATSSNLTLVNVQSAQLGQYRVAVTNSVGRVAFSKPVDLEIGPDPTVQSKDKIAEVPSSGGGGGGAAFVASSASGGTFSLAAGTIINQRFFNAGTMDRCEPAHCTVPGGASRWFQLAAASDGICTVDTLGSDVDTILAIYLQNFAICTNLYEPLVDCNNDALGSCDQMLAPNAPRERSSRVSFFATAGTVYRAVVDTAGGVRGTNIQFNCRFESPGALPAPTLQLAATTNCLLQLRGSSVTLRVATNLIASNSVFQWQFNGRRIAGATRDRLLVPFLNYSDAGRYSVIVQTGTNRLPLPGAAMLVVDPCRATPRLLGSAADPIVLEATSTLLNTTSWQMIRSIAPSNEPTLWDTGTGATRFYRALRPPP